MGEVSRAWVCCTPGPLTETERRFIDARNRLKELSASSMLQGFNGSSLGQFVTSGSIGSAHGSKTETFGE